MSLSAKFNAPGAIVNAKLAVFPLTVIVPCVGSYPDLKNPLGISSTEYGRVVPSSILVVLIVTVNSTSSITFDIFFP